MPQYSKKKQAHLMRESRCFRYTKKRVYTIYDYLKKRKIADILESIDENNDSQGKE